MKDVAAALRRVVGTLDALGASTLLRAQQTAEIVAGAYGDLPVHAVEALSPESDPRALVGWLRHHGSADVVAIVGHEPHLGMLVTWLMTDGWLRESRCARVARASSNAPWVRRPVARHCSRRSLHRSCVASAAERAGGGA